MEDGASHFSLMFKTMSSDKPATLDSPGMSETPDIGFEEDTIRRDEGDITSCMERMSLVLSGLGLAVRGYFALVAGHDVWGFNLCKRVYISELLLYGLPFKLSRD